MFRFLRILAQTGMVEAEPQARQYDYEARFNSLKHETSRRYLERCVSVIGNAIKSSVFVCCTFPLLAHLDQFSDQWIQVDCTWGNGRSPKPMSVMRLGPSLLLEPSQELYSSRSKFPSRLDSSWSTSHNDTSPPPPLFQGRAAEIQLRQLSESAPNFPQTATSRGLFPTRQPY